MTTTRQTTFLVSEHNALRREIEIQMVERRKIESLTMLSMAAIYTWILTPTSGTSLDKQYVHAALWIPVALAILGSLRWLGIQLMIIRVGDYISEVESGFVRGRLGWETYLSKRRGKELLEPGFHNLSKRYLMNAIFGNLEGWAGVLFWFLLIFGSLLATWLLKV